MKSILFITNIPAFYKVNLFEELSRDLKISVIFLNNDRIKRNKDFFSVSKMFSAYYLRGIKLPVFIYLLYTHRHYDEIVVGGWDRLYYWLAILFPFKKISMVLESSKYESDLINPIKKMIKRNFLKRVKRVYASGTPHKELLDVLGYKNEVLITKGVGLINYPDVFFKRKRVLKPSKFLYVGRLEDSKGIVYLLDAFKVMPSEFTLTIVGTGSRSELGIKHSNVNFLGHVDNKNLNKIYQDHDMLIVPSLEEPWGLVVEEAIANQLPVMVSDKVGSNVDLVLSPHTGIVFKSHSVKSIVDVIYSLQDGFSFQDIILSTEKYSIREKDMYQIKQYYN